MIDGGDVVHDLVVPAPVEQVFDMFTDPRRLVRWIGIAADLEPRPGGRFRFEVTPGMFGEVPGEIRSGWLQSFLTLGVVAARTCTCSPCPLSRLRTSTG